MSRQPTPAELRRQRKERRGASPAVSDGPGEVEIAQGRAEPMMGLTDLPIPVDAPDASGPLDADETERWDLCQNAFRQYRAAWWVAARALDVALRGRLWRAEYETARQFISDVAGMSTSNAYRQIAGAGIAGILAGHPEFERESNDESRMRDSDAAGCRPLEISQRAADALSPLREDWGEQMAASAYRVIAQTTGQDAVSERTVRGIVQQIPRRADTDLSADQIVERACQLATAPPAPVTRTTGRSRRKTTAAGNGPNGPLAAFAAYVTAAGEWAQSTEGMADAYAAAADTDPETAAALAKQLHAHMEHATRNFPDA